MEKLIKISGSTVVNLALKQRKKHQRIYYRNFGFENDKVTKNWYFFDKSALLSWHQFLENQ